MHTKQCTWADSKRLCSIKFRLMAVWLQLLAQSLTLSAYVILHRSCMLQADSEKLRQAWIKAVQTSIATAYREKGDESEVSLKIKQHFLNFED